MATKLTCVSNPGAKDRVFYLIYNKVFLFVNNIILKEYQLKKCNNQLPMYFLNATCMSVINKAHHFSNNRNYFGMGTNLLYIYLSKGNSALMVMWDLSDWCFLGFPFFSWQPTKWFLLFFFFS